MSIFQLATIAFVLTAVIEVVTVALRFGLHLTASRHTASIVGRLTGGVRIHHGYLGVAIMIAAAVVWRAESLMSGIALATGIALVASDLIHHFLVLWLVTGRHEFDLFYPRSRRDSERRPRE